MPGHLRERIFQLSQGHSPEFSCRNRLSNPFSSGLLDLVPPTLLSQFWIRQFKRHLVSLFSTKAFLMGVSRGRLEASRAQGRTKNDLSKRRVPLRQSGKLCYQLIVIRTEAQRYQVSAQPNTGQDCCSPPPYGHPAGQNLSGVLLCQEHTLVRCTGSRSPFGSAVRSPTGKLPLATTSDLPCCTSLLTNIHPCSVLIPITYISLSNHMHFEREP